ncbi:tetratricopeptide repeat protein [Candidatus Uabimicrobium amorphum]|uniref:Tetratricopeptide repeat protein n=1 Tax=Uabimicrobium amorphum TaxID=2596890 RepID=A0A5S9F164_UABAM|nr:tetratricopeptide repeat protein [Candidatus Uabimicrobium amorphum]BBM82236.1 hypothetical protein UABAM_00579 [Candidatus Uabimicrobium amorphum]
MQKFFIILLTVTITSIYAQNIDVEEPNIQNREQQDEQNMESQENQQQQNIEDPDASQQSVDTILEEAIIALEDSQYPQALSLVETVLQQEPDSGVALFLKGMIFIRTNKVDEGLKLLQKGKELGADLSIYQLEVGRAYFLKRMYPRAIAALSTFEEENPGDSEAITLLGYSYFFVKQFKNAQKYLRIALERDAADTDAIHYCLALCAIQLKQRKEMVKRIDETIKDKHKSWFRKSALELRDLAEDYKIAEAEKPWWIQAQIGGGYDSNPRAFGDEIPVDVDQRYDFFVSYFLRGEYHTKVGLGSEVYIKGSVFGRKYLELADEIDQLALESEVGFRHAFNDYLNIKTGIRNQYFLIDYDPFANDLDLFADLTIFQNEWIFTEIGYTLEYRWFLDDVNDDEDELGGFYHFFRIAQSFYIKPAKATFKVGYNHLLTSTEGENFDRNEGAAYVSLSGYILKDNYYGVRLEYRYRDFQNVNSIDGDERGDHVYFTQVFFAHKIMDSLSLFFTYTYERNDSNLADFDYSRQVFTAGFIASY